MRKILTLLSVLALLIGCAGALAPKGLASSRQTEVVVFAAASMTETLTEIAGRYMTEHPDVTVICNFDSSGTLKTQIQEGAPCDLFISAAKKQMDQLDINASADVNTEGLDFVDRATRVNLLENKVTLAVPEGNPRGVEGFDQLAELLRNGDILLAVGNSDVPVGQYTQKIFEFYGIDEADISGKLTYGSNVKEVATQVCEHSVDCGVIYGTDAFSAGLTVVDEATEAMCGGRVVYPAAVLKTAENPMAAWDFLAYLQTDACAEIFASVGFTPLCHE